jgi:ABC-type branched-subunit amino acid transport system ATPase component
LTLDAYTELLELHQIIFTAVQEVKDLTIDEKGNIVAVGTGKKTTFEDICEKSQISSGKKNTVDKNVSRTPKVCNFCLFL